MGIGKRLKEARTNKKLTQQELAEIVGVTGGAIGNYENETSHPRDTVLYALINTLEVDANFLFQDEMKQSPATPLADTLTKEQREYVDKYFMLNIEGKERVHAIINFEFAKQQGERKSIVSITPSTQKTVDFPRETVTLLKPSLPVCSGKGNYLDDNIKYENVVVLKNKYTYGADYIVAIQGDSMEPEFHDGDSLIVSDARGKIPIYGRVGIFLVNGYTIFRQLLTDRLHPYNPEYDDIVITDDVRYVGYVVGILDDSWVIE